MPIKEHCSHFQGLEEEEEEWALEGTNPAPPGTGLALSPGIPWGCAGNWWVPKRASKRGKTSLLV